MSSARANSQAWFNVHMHVAQRDVAEFDMLHCPRASLDKSTSQGMGRTGCWLQMNHVSLRNNRLKLKLDFRKITHRFREIYEILIRETNWTRKH